MQFFSPPLTRARARASSASLNSSSSSSASVSSTIINNKNIRKLVKAQDISHKTSPKTKSRTYEIISSNATDENAPPQPTTIFKANEPSVEIEIKKMKLSKDELEMNGAPVGDIFDIKVFSDDELTILAQPQTQIDNAILALRISTLSWAERYASIEVMRRSSLFSPSLMSTCIIGEVMSALSVELDSLRSCTIRNSVLCIKSFLKLQHFCDWISNGASAVYDEIIGKLLLKSCNGPKFLCTIISEVLLLGASFLPYIRLSIVMLSFSSHKNAEVCSQVYVIASNNFLNQIDILLSDKERNKLSIENSIRLFHKGLSAVKPTGRDVSKKALNDFKVKVGNDEFDKELKSCLSEEQCASINREINRATINQTSKARVPLKVLKLSNCAKNCTDETIVEVKKISKQLSLTSAKNIIHSKPWEAKKYRQETIALASL